LMILALGPILGLISMKNLLNIDLYKLKQI